MCLRNLPHTQPMWISRSSTTSMWSYWLLPLNLPLMGLLVTLDPSIPSRTFLSPWTKTLVQAPTVRLGWLILVHTLHTRNPACWPVSFFFCFLVGPESLFLSSLIFRAYCVIKFSSAFNLIFLHSLTETHCSTSVNHFQSHQTQYPLYITNILLSFLPLLLWNGIHI